jgi:hypothetical protein
MAVPIRDATPITSDDVVHHVPGRNPVGSLTSSLIMPLLSHAAGGRRPAARYV